ncbi:MAG: efflux transporter periplasmic adaptor subunit [Gammaproteobacteria bacterium RIFCSPHIGHO2_12_FULL_42_10]|nr:MAG: efflux transporter periplasmic adaptor subunit [Gammaproteobacteria bacterium RIFCSPHIGHO2_12_FULL_42_10]
MKMIVTPKNIKKTAIIAVILIMIYIIVHYVFNREPTLPAPQVIVQQPHLKKMVEYVTQTGTLVAYNSIDLVARVEGYLNTIAFTDGTFVKKGQALFVIQPKPYLEQLKAAQATVAIQKAMYAYTQSEYDRQQRMYKQNATSLNNVEKWLAKLQESEAEIAKAEANEVIAAINYGYTHIPAPFNGRIGRHLVDVGNLVGNSVATNLATIEQIDPIYVYFNLNELDLIKLRAAAKAQGFKSSELNQIPAYVKLQNETTFQHKGTLNFVNTALNAGTGTLEFRALFENHDYVLLPGLFVQVRIPIAKPKIALTIPDTAVLYDQIGPYVLTVDAHHIVQLNRVELGLVEQDVRAITKGLTAHENVIVSGLQFATPGNAVKPVENEG